mgnify:CR=1 FL=1
MKPRFTPEQRAERAKKFWIVPGMSVVRHSNDRPVMSVTRILSKRVKETVGACPFCATGAGGKHPETPEGQFCEDGKLMCWRNRTEGVEVQWIDALDTLQKAVYQTKELKEWVQPK